MGSTITLLVNGVARVTATDSTLSGGAPGILASGAADAGAWSGGSVGSGSGGTTYSVGGTVFGLSGTVVLQDNGADTLSVERRTGRSRSHPAGRRRGVRGDGAD